LVELLFVTTMVALLAGMSVPFLAAGLDRSRTQAAARYLASRFALARMEAVKRSAHVGIQFGDPRTGYAFAVYVDGNRNGVLTRDIERQVDRPLGRSERLGDSFPGVTIGVLPGVGIASDPVHIGASRLMSFTPLGTATSGDGVRPRTGGDPVRRARPGRHRSHARVALRGRDGRMAGPVT
jgi:hypothetical protein